MSLKKTNKRAPTNGFDSTTIDRLKNFSRFKTERGGDMLKEKSQ